MKKIIEFVNDANGTPVTVGFKVHYITDDVNTSGKRRWIIDAINGDMVTIRPLHARKHRAVEVPLKHISLNPFVFDYDKTVIKENALCAQVDENGIEMLDENTFNPIELKIEKILTDNTVIIENSDVHLKPESLRVLSL